LWQWSWKGSIREGEHEGEQKEYGGAERAWGSRKSIIVSGGINGNIQKWSRFT